MSKLIVYFLYFKHLIITNVETLGNLMTYSKQGNRK